MMKWLISRILLESMMLILSPLFPKPFFLSPAPSARCPRQSHGRNYLTSAGCIANEKIVCFYCNLIYINIHSRIKFLEKKKVSFSECPGRQRGATNRAIHKNVTFGKHCFKKASPVEIPSVKKKNNPRPPGTPASLLRKWCTEKNKRRYKAPSQHKRILHVKVRRRGKERREEKLRSSCSPPYISMHRETESGLGISTGKNTNKNQGDWWTYKSEPRIKAQKNGQRHKVR